MCDLVDGRYGCDRDSEVGAHFDLCWDRSAPKRLKSSTMKGSGPSRLRSEP